MEDVESTQLGPVGVRGGYRAGLVASPGLAWHMGHLAPLQPEGGWKVERRARSFTGLVEPAIVAVGSQLSLA